MRGHADAAFEQHIHPHRRQRSVTAGFGAERGEVRGRHGSEYRIAMGGVGQVVGIGHPVVEVQREVRRQNPARRHVDVDIVAQTNFRTARIVGARIIFQREGGRAARRRAFRIARQTGAMGFP